jgi:hypothetical protein
MSRRLLLLCPSSEISGLSLCFSLESVFSISCTWTLIFFCTLLFWYAWYVNTAYPCQRNKGGEGSVNKEEYVDTAIIISMSTTTPTVTPMIMLLLTELLELCKQLSAVGFTSNE